MQHTHLGGINIPKSTETHFIDTLLNVKNCSKSSNTKLRKSILINIIRMGLRFSVDLIPKEHQELLLKTTR